MSTPSTEENLVASMSDRQDNQPNANTPPVEAVAVAVAEAALTDGAAPGATPFAASNAAPQVATAQVATEGTPFDKMVQNGALTATPEEGSATSDVDSQVSSAEVAATEASADAVQTPPLQSEAIAPNLESASESTTSESSIAESANGGHVDASLEIDHRRAKQLLDRALLLSERGDFAGAILAARQAVVLTPTSPTGHSMLGLLHERAGDLEKAIASYEKVLQLAPHSTLERDNLERLKATLAQENASVIFHFDDNELFEEPEALPSAVPPARTSPVSVAAAGSMSTPAVLPAVAKTAPVSVSSGALMSGRASSGPPVVAPMTADAAQRPPVLRALAKQPSFYFKTVPLVATTALGLLFMTWAQGVSQSKRISDLAVVSPPPTELDLPADTPPVAGENFLPENGANANPTPPPSGTAPGGDVFGRGQAGTVAQVGKAVVAPPVPGKKPVTRVTTGAPRPTPANGTAPAPLPPSSTSPIIPPPTVSNSGSSSNGSSSNAGTGAPFAGLGPITPRSDSAPAVRPGSNVPPAPAPVVSAPAAPAAPIAPAGDGGGNSRGGAFFNPGSQPRGVIRVDSTRPASATAPRPASAVRRAESAAAAAAAQGNTGRVISSMTDSIQRLSTGYAYQRRAMAFLDSRDYGRAADDFQSAIAAYNDQINRNQDVEDARNGLRACQSGLRLALNNMRR